MAKLVAKCKDSSTLNSALKGSKITKRISSRAKVFKFLILLLLIIAGSVSYWFILCPHLRAKFCKFASKSKWRTTCWTYYFWILAFLLWTLVMGFFHLFYRRLFHRSKSDQLEKSRDEEICEEEMQSVDLCEEIEEYTQETNIDSPTCSRLGKLIDPKSLIARKVCVKCLDENNCQRKSNEILQPNKFSKSSYAKTCVSSSKCDVEKSEVKCCKNNFRILSESSSTVAKDKKECQSSKNCLLHFKSGFKNDKHNCIIIVDDEHHSGRVIKCPKVITNLADNNKEGNISNETCSIFANDKKVFKNLKSTKMSIKDDKKVLKTTNDVYIVDLIQQSNKNKELIKKNVTLLISGCDDDVHSLSNI